MKKINYYIFPVVMAAVCANGLQSCTKLDENVYSSIPKEDFYKDKREVMQAAMRPFTHMQSWLAPTGGSGYYYHSELSADQVAWPQKGRHGYDSGDHIRQHYHTWTSTESRTKSAWEGMWTGLGFVNNAIHDIEATDIAKVGMTQAEKDIVITQLKVMRAFHYIRIMDLWGNVPISTEIVDKPINPETKPRAEVFAFIQAELEQNVPKLPKTEKSNVGEISMAAGYAMLAELYLNAEKWGGKKMYDQCIQVCDKIISGQAGGVGGTPALSNDLISLYSNNNSANPESLFQFQYSRKAGLTFDWGGFYMGYDYMKEVLKVGYGGWNALVVIPSAFNAYTEATLERRNGSYSVRSIGMGQARLSLGRRSIAENL